MNRFLIASSMLLVLTTTAFRVRATGRVEGTVHAGGMPAIGAVVILTGRDVAVPEASAEPVVIDQIELRFVPQVVAVLPGTTVVFPNSDPILHNVFSPRGPGAGFNLGTYPPGETRSRRFTEAGVHVILCHVHPEMVAYVAVVTTPYYAVVDSGGRFAFDNVPAGRYVLEIWRARRTWPQREVTVTEDSTVLLELQLPR